jgi:hypothetical protein
MTNLPVIAQLKSLVQVTIGDKKGALKTQERFVRECMLTSQIFSLIQSIKGDNEGAIKTQKMFLKATANMIDGIPVAGHVKGAIHYACGDKAGGHQAMKSSSRTIGK